MAPQHLEWELNMFDPPEKVDVVWPASHDTGVISTGQNLVPTT